MGSIAHAQGADKRDLRSLQGHILPGELPSVALVFSFIRTRCGLWFKRDGREYWRSKDNVERPCRDTLADIAKALGTSRDTVRRSLLPEQIC